MRVVKNTKTNELYLAENSRIILMNLCQCSIDDDEIGCEKAKCKVSYNPECGAEFFIKNKKSIKQIFKNEYKDQWKEHYRHYKELLETEIMQDEYTALLLNHFPTMHTKGLVIVYKNNGKKRHIIFNTLHTGFQFHDDWPDEIIPDFTNSVDLTNSKSNLIGITIKIGEKYAYISPDNPLDWYQYKVVKKEDVTLLTATNKPIIKKEHAIDNFINNELAEIIEKHGKFNNNHEAYSVLLEEIEEVGEEFDIINNYIKSTWDYIKRDNDSIEINLAVIEEASRRMITELVQVIAVVRKTLMGIEDEKGNPTKGYIVEEHLTNGCVDEWITPNPEIKGFKFPKKEN